MKTDTQLRSEGPPLIYDNTMLQEFAKCKRRFYWFSRGLTNLVEPAYFTWGRAWGAGVNRWHELQGEEDYLPRLAEAIASTQIEWEKSSPVEKGNDTLLNLEETLKNYSKIYGEEEPWEMLYKRGELGFTIPIPGTFVSYGGAMDSAINWSGYGKMPREDKSTGAYINDSYMDQWNFSSQVKGYLWAFKQLVDSSCEGVYMNIASKRNRKEPELQFRREYIRISDWELAHFVREVIEMIDDIRYEWDRWVWTKTAMRDPIVCAGGAGRSACLYKRLCTLELEPWEMDGKFEFSSEFAWRDEWKPWEREGENE
uniref:PD-(D/E)XK nuclease superfamily protein n=1 Tax=viral metagenome TaxID=1070528 RepID=A0A6M3JT91_9ZZZZ